MLWRSTRERRRVRIGRTGKTMRHDSDVDALIVARYLPRGRFDRVAEFEVVEKALVPIFQDLLGKHIRTELSPVFKTPEETESGSPLFFDMVDDARCSMTLTVFLPGDWNGYEKGLPNSAPSEFGTAMSGIGI